MAFKFIACSFCGTRFHVRAFKSKEVGQYKGDIVYSRYLNCSKCKHETVFKIDTPIIDNLRFKVLMLECDLYRCRKDPVEYEKILAELENARIELNKISNEVKQCLHLTI